MALKQTGYALKYASAHLRRDQDLQYIAVVQLVGCLPCRKTQPSEDRKVVLASLERSCNALNHVDKLVKEDREFMLAATARNGQALQHASSTLRSDQLFVLAAVAQNADAWPYAEEALRVDQNFQMMAVAQ